MQPNDEIAQPSEPAIIDILALREHTNAAKLKVRELMGDAGPGLTERGIKIPLSGRELDAYVYAPSSNSSVGSLPIYVFFHGGGFCLGNRFDDMEANRRIALEANVVVVSLEYRLAPEHPFPQAIYDGLETLQWIIKNSNAVHPSASVSRGLIVGGTSAGANIANAVVYLNRNQENPVQITGQFLSVPPLLPLPVVPDRYRKDYLSFEENQWVAIPPPDLAQAFIEAYKPDINSPLFVPFNHPDGHTDVPPTYIQVCGLDSLRDEGLIYERVLREENGIPTRLDIYPGLPHHFWEFCPNLTQQIETRTKDTVKGILWLLETGKQSVAE
ncbi:Alpha/Beta hydrolase protein [Fusarium avenaceum]|nr:Alpha/Beta hydrolase protein [Fusarium avenaceum]